MARIQNDIPSLVFPWQVDTITFIRENGDGDDIQIYFVAGAEQRVLIDDRFSFGPDGKLVLSGLASILNDTVDSLIELSPAALHYGSSSVGFSFLYCRVNTRLNAIDFCENRFLTLSGPCKYTSLESVEYLSAFLYTDQVIRVEVDAVYWTGSVLEQQSSVFEEIYTDIEPLQINVSPSRFVRSDATLLRYTITAGRRKMEYRIAYHTPVEQLQFVNSFGCWETFPFPGTLETTSKLTRKSSFINGRYRLYDMDEVVSHKVKTGFLTPSMHSVFDDLCRSLSLFDASGRELTITDSESSRKNDEDDFPTGSVTYRLSDSLPSGPDLSLSRSFDHTFDNTFS